MNEIDDAIKRWIKEKSPNMLRNIAALIQKKAKELVPVDTGLLQSRIVIQPRSDGIAVVADTDYASHVEYGTRYFTVPLGWQEGEAPRKTKKGKYAPFLRPAAFQIVSKVNEIARSLE